MHRVLAIARVTLKDALRKKVLFTILFFAVVLTVTSGYLPYVRSEERIRQVSRVCLSGIGFFGMIVAVFLAAPSLPDDISRKTIFTVLTKPARRWEILAGKILGLGYVLAILLTIMGGLSFCLINLWAWKAGPDKDAGLALLGGNKTNYARSLEYDGLKLEISRPMIDSKRAIVSGFDKVAYHFRDLANERFTGDQFFVQVVVFSHSFVLDPESKEGTAGLVVTNPTTGESESFTFGADTLRPVYRGFRRGLIDANGAVDVTLLRRLSSGSYSAMVSSVAVLSQPSSYGMNFLKALVMRYAQYMVLVFMATAASTFLTSTVSTITALFIYFTGSLVEVLRAQALSLGTTTDIFTMAQHTHGAAAAAEMTGMTRFVNILLRDFYLGISVLFPDLDFFDASSSIAQNQYILNSTVFQALVYAGVYAGAAFICGWLVFRRKEAE
jgi:hypothetical protein